MRSSLFILLPLSLLLASCHYPQQTKEYGEGYNFHVVADSIVLQEDKPMHLLIVPEDGDTVVAYRGDEVVVAEIAVISEDSIDSVWVKIARDQQTQGWIHESELLDSVVPDAPISKAIHVFSNSHLLATVSLSLFVVIVWLVRRMKRQRYHIVHIDDIASPYPMMLCLTLSASAVLYASIQKFVPETWAYFYYHPTLNPAGLPFVLALFLMLVWLILILLVACIAEIGRCLNFTEAVLYVLSLVAILAILYVVFTLTTPYYVGYFLFVFYVVVAVVRYIKRYRARYICGYCGTPMRDLGKCPMCGRYNY